MAEEKFDALIEEKNYEAAFDLIDKENFENSKKPLIRFVVDEEFSKDYFVIFMSKSLGSSHSSYRIFDSGLVW